MIHAVNLEKKSSPLLTLRLVGYIVTQPALDDVPADFYASSETEDEVSFTNTCLQSHDLDASSLTTF